jgi:Carboxypeptidase regulatory-like domain/TonB dependent receptor
MPRHSRSFRRLLSGLALTGLAFAAGHAEAQTGGASLTGRVLDGTGAAAPGAIVTVVVPATGFTRSITSGKDGSYTFASLPVGAYDVTVKLGGFKTVEQKSVVLNVATTRVLDVALSVATVDEAITVTAESPVVVSEPAIGTVVSQKELEGLPLNGRQFANLGVLAPGTSLAYNPDPTKPGQLTVALNGGIGRNVNYQIDGGDNTDDTIGGALQNFSIEGVQEFKIQTQEYKAEYGRSTGGVLTVIGKSGTNDFHGSAFGFLRDDALNATTESETLAGGTKTPYSRKQFGGSIGGPIAKDKVHFFATYEGTRRDTNYTVNTGGLFPSDDGKVTPLPLTDDLASGKLTANLSPKQMLQVRFGYQKNTDKYGASPLATPDSLGTITNKYSSVLVGHSAQLSDRSFNEFVFQYTKFDNVISADSNDPILQYPSGAHSGQNINTPQSTRQVKYQFKDDLALSRTLAGQRHELKVGVNYIHEPTLGGDFSTGVAPAFTFLNDAIGSPVTDITQNGGSSTYNTPIDQFSIYAQDDWHATERLTLNVGVRYDVWLGFDLDQRGNAIWQTLSTQTRFSEPYLQDFQGGKGGVLENDKNNVAPRVGFTYDLTGAGKHLLRGGYGIYYDFPYTNATILFPAIAVQTNFGTIYNNNNPNGIRNTDGTLFQPGQPLPPNQLSGLAANPPNDVASPTLKTPLSRQASFGFSTEASKGIGLTVDLVNVQYRDLPFRFRANPLVPEGGRRFPDFGNFRLWYGNGTADYYGVNVGVRLHISDKLQAQGFYTLSKATGNVLAGADEFRLTDVNYQPDLGIGRDVSVNPLDPLCSACIGPLNTDARHRITFAGTYQLPYQISLSGVFRFHSATPYTIYAGRDLNGDGFLIDLPPGVATVGAGRGASFKQLDMRLSKLFKFNQTVGVEAMAEVFNVFNATNPAGFVGNQNASNFGQPTTFAGDPLQGEQRLAQFGLRLRF